MHSIRRCLVLLGLLALLTACGGAGSEPAGDPTSEETPVDESPASTSSPAGSADVRASVADLAASLGVEEAGVEVVSVEEVTWRDGSRGCAQPDMTYTQALVDGSRITLRAGGTTYEYHSGGSRPPQLCEQPTE